MGAAPAGGRGGRNFPRRHGGLWASGAVPRSGGSPRRPSGTARHARHPSRRPPLRRRRDDQELALIHRHHDSRRGSGSSQLGRLLLRRPTAARVTSIKVGVHGARHQTTTFAAGATPCGCGRGGPVGSGSLTFEWSATKLTAPIDNRQQGLDGAVQAAQHPQRGRKVEHHRATGLRQRRPSRSDTDLVAGRELAGAHADTPIRSRRPACSNWQRHIAISSCAARQSA